MSDQGPRSGDDDAGGSLAEHLRGLPAGELAALLRRRPDVTDGVVPESLDELAERLVSPAGMVGVLQETTLPHLQLLEAAAALARDTHVGVAELAEFLDVPVRTLDAPLAHLHELGIVVRRGGDLAVPDTARRVFGDPLRLGTPAGELLGYATVDTLRSIARHLGLPQVRKVRAELFAQVLDALTDQQRLHQLLDDAPGDVLLTLEALTTRQEFDYYDPDSYARRRSATEWAVERGLLLAPGYGWGGEMPAEVALALRGPGWTAPFTPEPPPARRRPPVRDDGTAAVETFGATLLDVLDHVARHPVPALKSGGVGVRELAKLAKSCATDERSVRLALELAGALGLVRQSDARAHLTPAFTTWRTGEPATQVTAAVLAWWTLPLTPTETVNADGKNVGVLRREPPCGGCRATRVALLETLAEAGPLAARDLAALTAWRRPLVHNRPPDDPNPALAEARTLGVVAGTEDALAVTALGEALLAGDRDALVAATQDRLPPATEQATFGSDLTAFVAGAPGARVSALLDATADRESRGGAVTWRFSPATVRRALDEGATAAGLLTDLAAVATGELPQPLTYLIADLGRRHGNLRLGAATSVVRSDDAALLAEVAADRKLAKHGLRLLAPTVLASDAPPDVLLTALRTAGYLPMPDDPVPGAPTKTGSDPDATVTPLSRADRAASVAPPDLHYEPVDADQLARTLLSNRPTAPSSLTARTIGQHATNLGMSEIRLLAWAIDTGGAVGIGYVSASGATTRRVISELQLLGSSLDAWCHLRSDERLFTLARIESVFPA